MGGPRLVLERDGRDWPNRAASRHVTAAGFRWHVQIAGDGPPILLIHGTGAATHSWRGSFETLAKTHTVIAPDLPGHGFTETPPGGRLTLPGMAQATSALLKALDLQPVLAVGHSAGAAIAARMALDGGMGPAKLISLNGAFLPFGGIAGQLFQPIAKMLFVNPFVPGYFARRTANPAVIERMIDETGSTLDAEGRDLYRRLAGNPAHVAGALGMMASWNLRPLLAELPKLGSRLVLVVGTNDKTVRPEDSEEVARLVPGSRLVRWLGLGHLAHEEKPGLFVDLVETAMADLGAGAPA
jgi:magnesium chelatase accessory protein